VKLTKIIVLEAVFDDSDMQSDYFHRDCPLETWYVCDLEGIKVTEAKLVKALRLLPAWLRNYSWRLRKGEDYSMSDHPYHQLRVDTGVGVAILNNWGRRTGLGFILTVTSLRIFEMNHQKDYGIPKTFEDFKYLVSSREREHQERKAKLIEETAKATPKIIQESTAIIDAKGFRILTQEEKDKMIEDFRKKHSQSA